MDSKRIKEIQEQTAYPESLSVYKALLQVWNECEQDSKEYSSVEVLGLIRSGIRAWKDEDCSDGVLNVEEWFQQFKKQTEKL